MKRDVISLTKNNENRRKLEFAKNQPTTAVHKKYDILTQILTDRKLASLGDAYVNFLLVSSFSERRQAFSNESKGNRTRRSTEKSRLAKAPALKNR
jgi:hypothetical protein